MLRYALCDDAHSIVAIMSYLYGHSTTATVRQTHDVLKIDCFYD